MFGHATAPWLHILLELLFKSTLLLSLSIFISALIRKRSASLRHFILAACMIGLLVLPLLQVFQFGWQINILPTRTAQELQSPALASSEFPKARFPGSDLIRSSLEYQFPLSTIESKRTVFAQHPPSRSVSSFSAGRILHVFLALIWAGGISLLLLRICHGLLEASRITREGKPVSDSAWRFLLNRFLVSTGLIRKIRLKSHQEVLVPLTWGLIKPVILIPSDHKTWPEDQKASALFHELSHIKRFDFITTLLVRFSLALFWFNPLIWVIYHRMKNEQERACDELVLKAGIKPSAYASHLLFFREAAGLRWAPTTALLSIFGRSSFTERLSAILKQKLTFKEVNMKTKIMIGAAVFLAVAIIGLARPSPAAPVTISGSLNIDPVATNSSPLPTESGAAAADHAAQKAEETEANAQAEKEEKEKQKKLDRHVLVITNEDENRKPIEITIIEGDKKKKIEVKESITIKKCMEGKVILLDPEGKEIKVLEGHPIRIFIKKGDVKTIKADKFIMKNENETLSWKEKGDKDDKDVKIWISGNDHIKVLKMGEEDSHHWIHENEGDAHHEESHIIKEGHTEDCETSKDVKKEVRVIMKPGKDSKHVYFAGKGEEDKDEIENHIKKIRESLKKLNAEGASVEEITKSLNELEEMLKKEEPFHTAGFLSHEIPGAFTIVEKAEGMESKKDIFITKDVHKNTIAVFVDEDGNAEVKFSQSKDEVSREVFDKTVERIKKELPDGMTLEPEFDEKSGRIKFKIKGIGSKDFSKDFITKLKDIIKEEIKNQDR